MELETVALRDVGVSRSTYIVWTGAFLTIALHWAFSGLYGYQRDELYFIACAKHLAWGYVDQPPLIAFITSVSLRLFGDTLMALRIVPAVAAGALVALAAHFAGRLGGGFFATSLTMIGVALAPFDLAVGNLLTMNAFEPLFWLALTMLAYDQVDAPQKWRWAAFGALAGIGFLNKWSMAVYAFSLLAGLLISRSRNRFLVPGLALSIGLAALIAAPNVVWQAIHGWPQLQVLQNAGVAKNEHAAPLMFLLEQLPLMNPFSAPLWIGGLYVLLRSRRFAGFGLAYFVLLIVEVVFAGKVYYVAPVYPALIAAGAVAFERSTVKRASSRITLTAAVVVAGLLIMPLAMPTLPLPVFLQYQRALDVRAVKMEKHRSGLVPQQFADQLGWNELELTIARVSATLPPGERASAAILTGDYGQAAAIEFLGRQDGLPPVISGHNEYAVWGPRGEHRVIVAIGVSRVLLAREYRSIQRVATYTSPFVLPQNNNLAIYVCRRPRIPLERFWPELRRYI